MQAPLDLGIVAHNVVRGDGQGRVMLELARAASRAGHSVTVYSWTLSDDLRSAERIRWSRIPRPVRAPQILADEQFVRAATRRLRRARHDVVCLKGACASPRSPFVLYASFWSDAWRRAWGTRPPRPDQRAQAALAAHRERRAAARARAIMAVSTPVAAEIRRSVPSAADHVHVVPNGVDFQEFRPVTPATRAAARRRFGIPDDAFVIGFVGEFRTPRKGLPALVAGVRLGADPREVVLVAGDGPPGRPDGGPVRTVGHVVPVVPVYHASDVVAVPSIYEPYSLVALEAAASAIPVVLSARCGAFDVLAGACVPLEDPTDARQVRAALDRVKDSPDAARKIADAGRRVAEDLAWESTARRAVGLLEEAAGRVRR